MTSAIVNDDEEWPRFVSSVDEIDSDWLSCALGRTVEIVSRERIGIGVGVLGELVRLGLDDGTSLVAKVPTSDPTGRVIGGLMKVWEKEWRFFNDMAPHLTIRVPRVHVNLGDPVNQRFALVMEDLSPAQPGDQIAGATPEQTRHVIEYIGRFHAQWWQHPSVTGPDWVPRINDPIRKSVASIFEAGWPSFVERFGDVVPARTLAWTARLGAVIGDYLDLLAQDPLTVIHGDFKMDNMLFDADGSVTMIDWQLLTLAPGMTDVAYFISTSLEPGVRAALVDELLDLYGRTLAAGNVAPMDRATLYDGLQKAVLLWMVGVAGSIGQLDAANERGVVIFDKIVTRLFATADALDVGVFLDRWLGPEHP